jgi:hypothetical protein
MFINNGGHGAMGAGTIAESFRAGQPTNAAVTKTAFATAMVFKISDRFVMEMPSRDQAGKDNSHGRSVGQYDYGVVRGPSSQSYAVCHWVDKSRLAGALPH